MAHKNDTNHVGYKHPPKAHQFLPGQSGNPNGRPKGARSFKSELREELNDLIPFPDGDQVLSISKQRALIKRMIAAAIEGDARVMTILVSLCTRASTDADDQSEDPEDQEIMRAVSADRRSSSEASNNSSHHKD